MNILVNIIYLFSIVSPFPIQCSRILAIFPFQSRSHQMMFDAITKGLARNGHQVDVMTAYPLKKSVPNYKIVVNLENKQKSLVNQWDVKFATELGEDTLPIIALPFGNGLCEYLGLPEMQEIIKNPPQDPPYDLLIVESFGSHCFIGIGWKLNIPVVMASTTIDSPWLDQSIGQPLDTTAYFPTFFVGYAHPMSFFQRIYNTIQSHLNLIRYRRFTDDVQNEQMKKYIDPNIPPLRELENNISLALVNSFHSLHGIRPLAPTLIEVAGLHVLENYDELPYDFGKWMNESTDGVIYFTLGSMVNIETFPDDVMRAFYSVFEKLSPVRILMKVANKDGLLTGLPKNVKISSWIPQVAILAHNNTKVFITHGGLMSTQEALTFGVPMIGIPLFADQYTNTEYYYRKNMALKLDHKNLTEDSIFQVLHEILYNPKYQEAAKHESELFLDRPMSAIDATIYWIEYAIKYGPGVMRSGVINLYWWQLALLDVIVFITVSIVFVVFLILTVFYGLFKMLFSGRNSCKKLKIN